VLPSGDVLVAEASNTPRAVMRNLFDYAMVSTMRRAAAMGVSANRITLLRDADGDGVAETQQVFLEGLNQPFGMALLGDRFYVGNTDGVVAFPYVGAQAASLRQGESWPSSSPAGIGRVACCPAQTG
jgi:glucose/arabinose dehydrogenase